MNRRFGLVIDQERCLGCDACTVACRIENRTKMRWIQVETQNVAQKDTPPARGRYPTSLWDPGEIIIDEISLPLDNVSSGRYTPVVGLYNLTTGERLLAPGNPNNEITLEPIELP